MKIPRGFQPGREAAIEGEIQGATARQARAYGAQENAISGIGADVAQTTARLALAEQDKVNRANEEAAKILAANQTRDAELSVVQTTQKGLQDLTATRAGSDGIISPEAFKAYSDNILSTIQDQEAPEEWKATATARAVATLAEQQTRVLEANSVQGKENYRVNMTDAIAESITSGNAVAANTYNDMVQESDEFTGEEKRQISSQVNVATRMQKLNIALAGAEDNDDLKEIQKTIEGWRTSASIGEDVREELIDRGNAEINQRRGELAVQNEVDAQAEKQAREREKAALTLRHAELLTAASEGLMTEEALNDFMPEEEISNSNQQTLRYLQIRSEIRKHETTEKFRASIYDTDAPSMGIDYSSKEAKKAATSQFNLLVESGLDYETATMEMLARSPVVPEPVANMLGNVAAIAATNPGDAAEALSLYTTIYETNSKAQMKMDRQAKLFFETAMNSQMGVSDDAALQLAYQSVYEMDERKAKANKEKMDSLPSRGWDNETFRELASAELANVGLGEGFIFTSALAAGAPYEQQGEVTIDEMLLNAVGWGTAENVYPPELQMQMSTRTDEYLQLGSPSLEIAASRAAKDIAATWGVTNINDGVEGAMGHNYSSAQLQYEPMPQGLADYARGEALPKDLKGKKFFVYDIDSRAMDPEPQELSSDDVAIVRPVYMTAKRADGALMYELHYKGYPIRDADGDKVNFSALPEDGQPEDLQRMTPEEYQAYQDQNFDISKLPKLLGFD